MLCDYVEVEESQWQMAIEGYIGGNRFAIIVEPEFEAQAMAIVRNLPGARRNNAKVIQGEKAKRDAGRFSPGVDSMVEVMSFNHKTAEYYLKASYGNVVRVDDVETLRRTARGITSEGLASGNYSMWRCDIDDADLVFGQGARERALHAKQSEYQQLLVQASESEKQFDVSKEIFALINQIKPVKCSNIMQSMMAIHRQLQQAESALSNLDLSDFESLEDQLAECKAQHQALNEQAKKLEQQLGGAQVRLKQQVNLVSKLADAQEVLQGDQETQERSLHKVSKIYPEFNVEDVLNQVDQSLQASGSKINYEELMADLKSQLDRCDREIHKVILEHNSEAQSADAIVYGADLLDTHSEEFFKRIVGLDKEVNAIHNRLKNNVLVERHEKLTTLKESFNTAFVTNLCHSIYQSINDGRRILDDLNVELESHRFGADRESFHFGYEWVPEYHEYWKFFKEVIAIPNLGDGATLFDSALSANAEKVRDKIVGMLLDKEEQQALRELARISDYRNYRNYEIYKEPEGKQAIALSQYGTGSGGQLETPAYIIRAAAVTSAFRFNDGNTHMRMVMVDEAFSKMDETRSREVIQYLTESLGLQLAFIMPSAKSGPFLDIISNQFVFSKCPVGKPVGQLNTRVLVDRKACNQDKIKTLWEQHRKTVRHQGMLDFMEDIV